MSIHRPKTRDARRVRRIRPERLIRAALETTRAAVESVQTAANHLNALILQHRVILVPEAAIVRESAALLQHLEQNFRRATLAQLKPVPRKRSRGGEASSRRKLRTRVADPARA
ncbi:MAG: hypothetical protein RL324_820 [Verrucomicrobiota bacterium]